MFRPLHLKTMHLADTVAQFQILTEVLAALEGFANIDNPARVAPTKAISETSAASLQY